MTALSKGKFADEKHIQLATSLFNVFGRTVVVDEKHMDAVTGLSASGPAYIYIILESLAEAGVKVGLPRDVATLLAAQMMKGASSVVLETGDHPALRVGARDAKVVAAGDAVALNWHCIEMPSGNFTLEQQDGKNWTAFAASAMGSRPGQGIIHDRGTRKTQSNADDIGAAPHA